MKLYSVEVLFSSIHKVKLRPRNLLRVIYNLHNIATVVWIASYQIQ